MQTLKQTMSNHPATVRYKDDLNSAYIRMKRDGYRHMPVIDERGDLIGLISDRDFQRAMSREKADSSTFPDGAKVNDYMSRPVRSLPEETQLIEAVNLMIRDKISAIVVMNEENITGIITHEDLLKILAALLQDSTALRKDPLAVVYNSPLGRVSEILSTAGI